ncbi:hypothetical protein [Bacillus sp. UNC438CL73TsuS30]|uniref:hypothetical protein n=1 Tax=Bacillus sp. UNC438CL73TsuS30 TaxID=1340434 RepID=UPI00047D5375|nr:hypothetical protein [Bacillus sp. UNC438CL73TsuS30]
MGEKKTLNRLIKAYDANITISEFTALMEEMQLDPAFLFEASDVCQALEDGVTSRSEAEAQIRLMLRYGKIKQ